MFISSVSNSQKSYTFKGLSPEIQRNQLKILLTQDIWNTGLRVKMPETQLEKDVLLEILQQRLKLDRLARLCNERMKFKTLLIAINNLLKENPSHPDLEPMIKEVEKKGNVESYLRTLSKNIEQEKKKREVPLQYFKEIDRLEEEYIERRLIKYNALNKFWAQINKGNINKDGTLSTEDLIKIISDAKVGDEAKVSKTASNQLLSKKQLLSQIQVKYEDMLRKGVDVYRGEGWHNIVAMKARETISEFFAEYLKKYPDLRADRVSDIDIYPIGDIWNDMDADKKAMKELIQKIESLKSKKDIKKEEKEVLTEMEKELAEMKKVWLVRLKYSVKYADANRERMIQAGKIEDYDYLTSDNKTLKLHKELFEAYKNNNDILSEHLWSEVVLK